MVLASSPLLVACAPSGAGSAVPSCASEAASDPPSSAEPGARAEPSAEDGPIRMAVTFDDLPGSPKAMTQILEVLETHGVPRVVGFVNGVRV